MIYFINTDVLPNKATNQYLLNLGVKNSSYRRNVTGDSRTDTYIHRLVNIMLRQARALGWKNLNLKKLHIKTGNQKDYLRLKEDHAAIYSLRQKDLEEIIKTQIQNYIGKVAPRAKCLRAGKSPIDIPMIIEWLPEKGLYWTPPMLYREVTEEVLEYARKKGIEIDGEKGTTYVVYDYDGNTIPVEGVKQCAQCQSILEIGTGLEGEPPAGHPLGNFPGQQVLRCPYRKCAINVLDEGESEKRKEGLQSELRSVEGQLEEHLVEMPKLVGGEAIQAGVTLRGLEKKRKSLQERLEQVDFVTIQKEWFNLPGEQKGLRTIPNCFGQDKSGKEYGDPEWSRDSTTYWKGFKPESILRRFAVSPLPFIPAKWYKTTTVGKLKPLGNQLDRQIRGNLLKYFGGAAIAQPNDEGFIDAFKERDVPPYNVETVVNPDGYITPTGNEVPELELEYVEMDRVIELQRSGDHPEPGSAEDPFQWQKLALERFRGNDFFGMVQACTGSGKTVFCADAMRMIYSEIEEWDLPNTCVNIVVPTIALLNQWYEFLTGATPMGMKFAGETLGITGARGGGEARWGSVGRHGGGFREKLQAVNVFVINTAARYLPYIMGDPEDPSFFDRLAPESKKQIPDHLLVGENQGVGWLKEFHEKYPHQFLIVDEAHRTAAPTFRRIYDSHKEYLLMVSATFPDDEDRFEYLESQASKSGIAAEAPVVKDSPWAFSKEEDSSDTGQGGMLCYYKYPHALKKGNISDFNLNYIRVALTRREQEIYGLLTDIIDDLKIEARQQAKAADKTEGQVENLMGRIEAGLSEVEGGPGEAGVQVPEVFYASDKELERIRAIGGSVEDTLDVKIIRVEKNGKTLVRRVKKAKKDSYAVFMMKVLGGARARISWSSGARLQAALDLLIEKLEAGKSIIVFHKSVDGAAALYKLLYERGWGCAPWIPDSITLASEPSNDIETGEPLEDPRPDAGFIVPKTERIQGIEKLLSKLHLAKDALMQKRKITEQKLNRARKHGSSKVMWLSEVTGELFAEKPTGIETTRIVRKEVRSTARETLAAQARVARELTGKEQDLFLSWQDALKRFRISWDIKHKLEVEGLASNLEDLGIRVQEDTERSDDGKLVVAGFTWSHIREEAPHTQTEDLSKLIQKLRLTLDDIKTGGENVLGLPPGQGGRPSGGWPVFPSLPPGEQLKSKTPSELADQGLKWVTGTIKDLRMNKKSPLISDLYDLYSQAEDSSLHRKEGLQPGRDMIGLYHSQMSSAFRERYLEAFKEGKIKCLISVQALLEGLDVPHCDVGVAVAADQSSIKIVQALGRVLRINKDSPDKKEYYFISADGTKDAIVEAKFNNEIRDQNQNWIIGKTVSREDGSGFGEAAGPTISPPEGAFTISDEQRIDIQREAGLPTTVEVAGFIKQLMPDRADWAEEKVAGFIERNSEKPNVLDADGNSVPMPWAEWYARLLENSGMVDDILDGETTFKQRVRVVHPRWVDPDSDCLPLDSETGRSVLTTKVPKRPRVQSQKPKPAGPEPIQGELF